LRTSSSSLGYLSAGFASKARAALSSAGSYVASTASSVAAAAAASSEGEPRGLEGNVPGKKQTWEEWARDWRDGRRAAIKGTETLYVVPGWAVKRPRTDAGEDGEYACFVYVSVLTTAAFDLHVSVSGFCNFVRDPGSTSRTQRAIIGIAKRTWSIAA
jgi:hypothetical protein